MGQSAIFKCNLVSNSKIEGSKNNAHKGSISDYKDESKRPYLSIVIPAYNEEKRIAGTLIETSATMDSFSISHEIIVVNDGSSDRTFEEASKIAEKLNNVKVVHYTQNGGKGNAIKYGCKFVTGDLVTFLDADLELHP
ncbi:MAG: glycosyltransferase family 2 protein, partial [Candidatus Methanoperedens sp.]|nr:glycosyltransferase family 2 protein [Candidatus Methanoperedens sp.]